MSLITCTIQAERYACSTKQRSERQPPRHSGDHNTAHLAQEAYADSESKDTVISVAENRSRQGTCAKSSAAIVRPVCRALAMAPPITAVTNVARSSGRRHTCHCRRAQLINLSVQAGYRTDSDTLHESWGGRALPSNHNSICTLVCGNEPWPDAADLKWPQILIPDQKWASTGVSQADLDLSIPVYHLHPTTCSTTKLCARCCGGGPLANHRPQSGQLSWSHPFSQRISRAGPAAAHVVVHEGLGGHVGEAGCLEVGGRLARVLQPALPCTGVASEIGVPQRELQNSSLWCRQRMCERAAVLACAVDKP